MDGMAQGDTENEEVFETGFDGARQISYQFVSTPEPVVSLFDSQVTHISCGEEHSAAVTSEYLTYLSICIMTDRLFHVSTNPRRGQTVLLGLRTRREARQRLE